MLLQLKADNVIRSTLGSVPWRGIWYLLLTLWLYGVEEMGPNVSRPYFFFTLILFPLFLAASLGHPQQLGIEAMIGKII